MPNHIENLLTSIGLPAEDATRIANLPETDAETFDPAPIIDRVKSNFKTQFKNDPQFFNEITVETLPVDVRKKLESNQYGRAAAITRDKLLKGLGLTDSEIADLTPEQREKLELFVPAVADKFSKTKATNPQLQSELIEARRKIEELSGKEESLKSHYESQASQKIAAALFNAQLVAELSSIPNLKIPASDIARTAAEIVSSRYGFAQVGDFNVELRQKANPEMKVLKENSSHELTLKEVLTQMAQERGWVGQESDSSRGSGTVTVDPTRDGKLKMNLPPHLVGKIGNKMASEK